MEAAVCSAAAAWKTDLQARGAAEHMDTSPPEGSWSTSAGPSSRDSEEVVIKKQGPMVRQTTRA